MLQVLFYTLAVAAFICAALGSRPSFTNQGNDNGMVASSKKERLIFVAAGILLFVIGLWLGGHFQGLGAPDQSRKSWSKNTNEQNSQYTPAPIEFTTVDGSNSRPSTTVPAATPTQPTQIKIAKSTKAPSANTQSNSQWSDPFLNKPYVSDDFSTPTRAPKLQLKDGVFLVIRDSLGDNQVREKLTLYLEGQEVHTFSISRNTPNQSVSWEVPQAREYKYTLSGYVEYDTRKMGKKILLGQGVINTARGATYDIQIRLKEGETSEVILTPAKILK